MEAPNPPLKISAVANVAGLSESWAWKAREQGVLYEPYSPEDVVALRVYAFVSQIVWPGVRRPRSARQSLELWQEAAVAAAREAYTSNTTTPDTAMWVLEDRVRLVTQPWERAAVDLQVLAGKTAVRIPVGLWIMELPDALDRRRRGAKSAA
ncbi:hypothetical protein AB0D66_21660 [Streptomyces sp. NPDC048270]|uniref:hypothetical protein n=1 Tax=Streptomyces sp. NPDC048270 TaxID=3154615 RepID=UPI0033FA5BF0